MKPSLVPSAIDGERIPLVSIIIVNWNGLRLLADCLDSVLGQTFTNYEIVFVDNGSSDGSAKYVLGKYPQVNVIENNSNLGFTGGNIVGLEHARGEFIVLLNNDAVLCPTWLQLMHQAMAENANVGICASKILIAGTDFLDCAGDLFTTAFNGTKRGAAHNHAEYNDRTFVAGACAAAAIYRRSMLDEIGFLDEDFFLDHEDTDLSMRAWLAGWKCLYVPEAVVHHKVSSSQGNESDLSTYYFARNSLWVFIKNAPAGLIARLLPQRILYEICSFGYFCVIRHKWKPFLRGKIHSIHGIPRMIRKRRQVQNLIRLSNDQIRSELMPVSAYLVERLRSR